MKASRSQRIAYDLMATREYSALAHIILNHPSWRHQQRAAPMLAIAYARQQEQVEDSLYL